MPAWPWRVCGTSEMLHRLRACAGFGRFLEIFYDMGNTCVTPEVERVVAKLCTAAQALAYNTPEVR